MSLARPEHFQFLLDSGKNWKCPVLGRFSNLKKKSNSRKFKKLLKFQDCNRCKCLPNGKAWVCTRKMCLSSSTTSTPVNHQKSIALSTKSCTPGSRFKKNCNWCFCGENGEAICTLMGCGIERPKITVINDNSIRARRQTAVEKIYTTKDLENPNFRCTPSYSFKVECNTCWCAADGKKPRYCTRIACKSGVKVYPTLPPTPQIPTPAKAQG